MSTEPVVPTPGPAPVPVAHLEHHVRTALFDEVAGAVIGAMLADEAYLQKLAEEAVGFRERVGSIVLNEVLWADILSERPDLA